MEPSHEYTMYYDRGDLKKALQCVQAQLAQAPYNSELWNDAGVIFYSTGRVQDAAMCFERALELPGAEDEVALNLQKARKALGREHPVKIAFFCGADGPSFLSDILDYARSRYEVRLFEGKSNQDLYELMQWSDISWFEWCTNLAAAGSQYAPVCKTIIRLHRYEAYVGWVRQIRWDHVDRVITVGNPAVLAQLRQEVPCIEQRTNVVEIPNGVDVDRYPFVQRSRGKKLAFVANIREVKNPMLLLHCMEKLHRIAPEYTLHMAGRVDDAAIFHYLQHMIVEMGLQTTVFIEGWQDDICRWLEDKSYIVCTSVIESQGMGILEGMACGLKPIIHNYPGASEVFGPKYVFTTIDDFCGEVLSEEYQPREYRQFVESRYPLSVQLQQIEELLRSLAGSAAAVFGEIRSAGENIRKAVR